MFELNRIFRIPGTLRRRFPMSSSHPSRQLDGGRRQTVEPVRGGRRRVGRREREPGPTRGGRGCAAIGVALLAALSFLAGAGGAGCRVRRDFGFGAASRCPRAAARAAPSAPRSPAPLRSAPRSTPPCPSSPSRGGSPWLSAGGVPALRAAPGPVRGWGHPGALGADGRADRGRACARPGSRVGVPLAPALVASARDRRQREQQVQQRRDVPQPAADPGGGAIRRPWNSGQGPLRG